MSAHLLILYPVPKDTKKFDRAYREEHLPYAGPKLVGATGVTTKRVVGPAFAPPPYHLMSDVSFPSLDALKACATSEGGKQALAHAASISSGGAPMRHRRRGRSLERRAVCGRRVAKRATRWWTTDTATAQFKAIGKRS